MPVRFKISDKLPNFPTNGIQNVEWGGGRPPLPPVATPLHLGYLTRTLIYMILNNVIMILNNVIMILNNGVCLVLSSINIELKHGNDGTQILEFVS